MSFLSRISSYNGYIDLIKLVVPKSSGGVSKVVELFNTVLPLITLIPGPPKDVGWGQVRGVAAGALMLVPMVNLVHLGSLSIYERSLGDRVSLLMRNLVSAGLILKLGRPWVSLGANALADLGGLLRKVPYSVQHLPSSEGVSPLLKVCGTACYLLDIVQTKLVKIPIKHTTTALLVFEGLYQGAQWGAQGLKLYHQTKSLDYQTYQLVLDVGVKAILSFVRLYQAYRICYPPKLMTTAAGTKGL